jgi:hypothetical protein
MPAAMGQVSGHHYLQRAKAVFGTAGQDAFFH